VVIAVQDATAVRNQELGDCRNHTFACEATGSAQKQDGGAHLLIFRQITFHGSGSGKPYRPESSPSEVEQALSGQLATNQCAHPRQIWNFGRTTGSGVISALSPTLRLPVQGPSAPYVSRTISTMYSRIAFHSWKGVRLDVQSIVLPI
jgi:hypothetical protein